MKLVLAIVNNDDSTVVSSELTRQKFSVTKLATTGGFLMTGNTTLLIGTDDDKVDTVIATIREKSKRRTQHVAGTSDSLTPIEVNVGGATIFVVDVERFEKV